MIGIYCFKNKTNGKVYVGQSKDVGYRQKSHKKIAHSKTHHCYHLPFYKDVRKYSIDNFEFEILEECLLSELNEKEIFWIKKLKACDSKFGYNIQTGGQKTGILKLNSEEISEIVNLLKTSNKTKKSIGLQFKVSHTLINYINRGKIYHNEEITYPIRKLNDKPTSKFCIDCGKVIDKRSLRCIKCNRNKLND